MKVFYILVWLLLLLFLVYIFMRCLNILKNYNDVCKVVSVNNDESFWFFGIFYFFI